MSTQCRGNRLSLMNKHTCVWHGMCVSHSAFAMMRWCKNDACNRQIATHPVIDFCCIHPAACFVSASTSTLQIVPTWRPSGFGVGLTVVVAVGWVGCTVVRSVATWVGLCAVGSVCLAAAFVAAVAEAAAVTRVGLNTAVGIVCISGTLSLTSPKYLPRSCRSISSISCPFS